MNESIMDDPKVQQRLDNLKDEQEAFKKERLERGQAFEEMTRTKGWEIVKSYMLNYVRDFTNTLILSGFSSVEALNLERGKILGMRQILNEIEASTKALKDERDNPTA